VAQSPGYGDPYKTVIVTTAPSPYWGYTYNPYAVFVPGPGDIIRAHGDYLIKTQEARLLREKVRQEMLVTRRKQIEQWEWELDFWASFANRRDAIARKNQVERALNFPPLAEIVLAVPLNNLLDELKKRPSLPAAGSTPVNAEWLDHIHVTVDGRGNLGLLKADTIFWPQFLLRPAFAEDRKKIEQHLTEAKRQALLRASSTQNPELLGELGQTVAACRQRADQEFRGGGDDTARTWRHYVDAKRFLQHVDNAIFVLEQPDAAYYLNPLQGKTVAELVAHMKKEGVRFAPATAGGERAYAALHRALADEVRRLKEQQPSANKP
jgi:hypothetical protein